MRFAWIIDAFILMAWVMACVKYELRGKDGN